MLYRLHFCADEHEARPTPCGLEAVEADSPLAAIEHAVAAGMVPQDRLYRWARVVVAFHPDGSAKQVLRVPITATGQVPLDWRTVQQTPPDLPNA